MNEVSKIALPELPELSVSRRTFVGGAAGLTFAVTVSGLMTEAVAVTGRDGDNTVNAYVTIRPDETITIMSPATEMGQGIMICLPLIVAEYMDANWDKVTVEMAPANHKLYGNPKFGGIQYTVASLSVMGYWGPLTTVGAQTRQVLINAAAEKWGVAASECSTEPSKVVHKSNKSLTYGQIAAFAKPPAEMPKVDSVSVKNESNYRLLGKDTGRVDVPAKTNG